MVLEKENMKKEQMDQINHIRSLNVEKDDLKHQLLSFENLGNTMQDMRLENDRLHQQLSAHKVLVERFEASDASLKEQQTTISQLQMEEESMKKTLRSQISDIYSLNEENDRLKQQLMSIENLASQTTSLELENGKLRQQQQAAYDSHIEKVKEYELNIREKEKNNNRNGN